jgi:hypothetical protein
MQAFSHVKDSVPLLKDKWFIANEWMSILPEHYSSLRGYEDKINTRSFTTAMNKFASHDFKSSENGVYANQYGTTKQWYYLFTTDKSCPNVPTKNTFNFSNMNEFIRSSNNNSSSSSSNGINNNSGERKKSDVIRDESCFVDKKIFNLFMPKECIFEEYINPEEAVRETLVRIKRVCEKSTL